MKRVPSKADRELSVYLQAGRWGPGGRLRLVSHWGPKGAQSDIQLHRFNVAEVQERFALW